MKNFIKQFEEEEEKYVNLEGETEEERKVHEA